MYYIAKVKELNEDEKPVNKTCLVKAQDLTEAERLLRERVFEKVVSVSELKIFEFIDDDGNRDEIYKARINCITIDEVTGKESTKGVSVIVASDNFNNAILSIQEVFESYSYEITGILKTNISYVLKEED